MIANLTELTEVPGQGRLIVAAKDLAPGTLVHASLPYAFAPVSSVHDPRATSGSGKRCLACLTPLAAPAPLPSPSTAPAGPQIGGRQKKSSKVMKQTKKGSSRGAAASTSSSSNSSGLPEFLHCVNYQSCGEGYCSESCRESYHDSFHAKYGECAAWRHIKEGCTNKSGELADWVAITSLMLARGKSELTSSSGEKEKGVKQEVPSTATASSTSSASAAAPPVKPKYAALLDSDDDETTSVAEKLNPSDPNDLFPSGDQPIWKPQPKETAVVAAPTTDSSGPNAAPSPGGIAISSITNKALQRLQRYESMPMELVDAKAARSFSSIGSLVPSIRSSAGGSGISDNNDGSSSHSSRDTAGKEEWLKLLWTPGSAYKPDTTMLVSHPTEMKWADVAALVCNLSMIEKDHLSLFSQAYRVYAKIQLKAPTVFPLVSEHMFLRVCGGIKCNSFDYSNSKGDKIGNAVLPWSSYFNHSCAPNLVCPNNGKIMACYTSRAIKKGEPLNISYLDISKPANERRPSLARSFMFWCECVRCKGGASNDAGGTAGAASSSASPPECPSCGKGYMRTIGELEQKARGISNAVAGSSVLLECTNCGMRI